MDISYDSAGFKSLESAAVGAAQSLWNQAYEHRYAIGGAALTLGAAYLGRGLLGRSIETLAASLSEAKPVVQTGLETCGEASETAGASFKDLINQMRARGITAKDLRASVDPARQLGKGSAHAVYTIADLPDYVVRAPKAGHIQIGPLVEIADVFPEENIGQEVARTGNLGILKRQSGEVLPSNRNTPAEDYSRAVGERTETLAAVPQESYDAFARTLSQLNARKLYWDPVADNLHLNKANMTFGLIDVVSRPSGQFLNTTRNMLDAVHPEAESLQPYYDQIAAKIETAAAKAGLPKKMDWEL